MVAMPASGLTWQAPMPMMEAGSKPKEIDRWGINVLSLSKS